MKWLQRSLFRKMLLCCSLPVLLGLLFLGPLIVTYFENYAKSTTEQELIRQGKSINAALHQSKVDDYKSILVFFEQTLQKRITLFDQQGQIIAVSYADEVYSDKTFSLDNIEKLLKGEVVRKGIVSNEEHQEVLSVIIPWGSEEDLRGGIEINTPVETIYSASQSLREMVLWTGILASILATFASSILYWSISRPLKKIETTATEIAIGHYDKRLPPVASNELGEMALALNRLAQKLGRIEEERTTLEQRREDLLTNISHELRTPLTAIQGFVEAILDGLVQDEATLRRYLEVIEKESKHMNRLVEDLMDLIKLKDRKIQLSRYYVQVDELMEKIKITFEPQIKAKGNELHADYPAKLSPLLADAVRLEQILINLVHNANKFTEHGWVRMTVEEIGDHIVIAIADNGIGIPSHDLDRIWERFYKAQQSRRDQGRGAGLGLAIVKELVELHGGSIRVQSRLGQGTTFTMIFPLDAPEPSA